MRLNFKQKFILPTLTLMVLGMAGSTVMSYMKSRAVVQKDIVNQLKNIAGLTATTMDAWVEDRTRDIQTWNTFEEMKKALVNSFSGKAARKKASGLFAGWQQSYGYYEAINLADNSGVVIASSTSDVVGKVNVRERGYFQRAVTGESAISPILKSKTTGDRVFVLATRVKRKGKTPPGVLFAVIKVSAFSRQYTDKVKVGQHGTAFIFDAKGRVIGHPDKSLIGTHIRDLGYDESILSHEQGVAEAGSGSDRTIAAFKKSKQTGCTVVVRARSDEIFAPVAGIARFSAILAVVATLVAGFVIYLIAVAVSRPIVRVVEGLKDAAEGEGDLTKRLDINSSDEIGMLGKWFNLFVERVQDIIRDVAGNSRQLTRSSSDLFEVSSQMRREAEEASGRTASLAASAEEMSANMEAVAALMSQASGNIQTVSSTAEELTATISEIAANSAKGRAMAGEAVGETEAATQRVRALSQAASEIDKVVETITDISEQVNLLALNATIEAARAGAAGRGFAVVANEIKELARQTSQATGEIKAKVQGIQDSTGGTISQIADISTIVKDVNDIVTTIAAAVEEQSIATREIAENVSQASRGIDDVAGTVSQSSYAAASISQDISDIRSASDNISQSSAKVSTSADELSGLAGSLDAMVKKFVI